MPRVLVVDDDPMVCMAIEIYLERHSFHVTIADGGETGNAAVGEEALPAPTVGGLEGGRLMTTRFEFAHDAAQEMGVAMVPVGNQRMRVK